MPTDSNNALHFCGGEYLFYDRTDATNTLRLRMSDVLPRFQLIGDLTNAVIETITAGCVYQ